MKRVTPENDYDRLAERIWQKGYRNGKQNIGNRDDFNAVFDGYLTQSGRSLSGKQRDNLRENTFRKFKQKHPGVSNKKGVDSKPRKELFKRIGSTVSPAEFNLIGYTVNRKTGQRRTVMVRRTVYVRKKTGGQVTVYRDSGGKFARYSESVKKQPSVSSVPVTYDQSTKKYV